MKRVMVTGSDGFLGGLCLKRLHESSVPTTRFDLPRDVLDRDEVREAASVSTDCLHLAAHKHAPYGEESPAEVAELNILGTRNVVEQFGPNVVLASTCKAADPMTAYGASKLIAERIVLNAGGRVVRLVNVWDSSGSVARTWREVPAEEPLPVSVECQRMWITAATAVMLLISALDWPSGRYAPMSKPVPMMDTANTVYPDRPISVIPPRRGDRPLERVVAEYEWAEKFADGVMRIRHPADVGVPAREMEPG